ncbi:MAG: hypothetical protein IT305_16550 [Chloroflexi bacterium]|nr:hypothetical protein [Chloroflexota bacterium]
MHGRPTLWTTATIRGRRADDASVTAYFRRYALYVVVGLTLAVPFLVVLVEQWAPS